MNDNQSMREVGEPGENSPPVLDDAQAQVSTGQPTVRPSARRLALTFRVVQVRLRFVIVLVAAFLVIGLWGNLRNVWDTLVHRVTGSHSVQQTVSNDTDYFCPMCPGVASDWPAICPVCNMDLVRRKKGEAVVLPEGVVARMQFSPYRVQLAGIKTSVVGRQALSREIVVAGRIVSLRGAMTSDRARSENFEPLAPSPSPARREGSIRISTEFALECDVFATDLPVLTAGRRALVLVDAWRGAKPLAGSVLPQESESSVEKEPDAKARNATIRIRLEDAPAGLRPGMYCTARVAIPLAEIEPFASSKAALGNESSAGYTAVPETAVVDTGARRVVFVETMPGMFDGVEVTLGPRCGDFYPVVSGLEPGQKVATIGAFLIDAEARLNPNAAADYFGAARSAAQPAAQSAAGATESPAKAPPANQPLAGGAKKKTNSKLSAADQKLAEQQKTCPVTDLPLDSMGGPVAVAVAGQKVFICCQGCEARLKKDPQKYLAKLKK